MSVTPFLLVIQTGCYFYHVSSVLSEFRAEVEEIPEFQVRLSWLPYVTCEFRVEAEETVE
jgi:hypothetical protein